MTASAPSNQCNDIMAWYMSMPNVSQCVMCQAWRLRGQSPVIKVQGGVNARMASIEVATLAQCDAAGAVGPGR